MRDEFDYSFEKGKLLETERAMETITSQYTELLDKCSIESLRALDIIYLYNKLNTVRDMTPKGFGEREENRRCEIVEETKVIIMNKIRDYFGVDTGFAFDEFVFQLKNKEENNPNSAFNVVRSYKEKLRSTCELFLENVKVILPHQNLTEIRCANHRENQYYNEIVDAVFAVSNYNGILKYISRANAGGMIVQGKKISLPKNPFALNDATDSIVPLVKPVSIYSIDARLCEPVIDFSLNNNGDPVLRFGYEWISRNPSVFCTEQVTNYLPTSFFEDNEVYVNENGEEFLINSRVKKSSVK